VDGTATRKTTLARRDGHQQRGVQWMEKGKLIGVEYFLSVDHSPR
jgi:hypothetical protein